MDLWSRIIGTVLVELTAADPQQLLRSLIRRGMTLHNLEFPNSVRCRFFLSADQWKELQKLAEKKDAKVRILAQNGLLFWFQGWLRRPVLLFFLGLLTAGAIWLPGRILFVSVVGNETVPTRLILETAGAYGLNFGAERRAVRSERIKNELLGAITSLEWVGVNTSGSVATIQVRERKPEPEPDQERICDLIAGCDGLVESVTVTRGSGKVAPGQAVRKGEILISGLLDLGICMKTVSAEGEVFARTLREMNAILPGNRVHREEKQNSVIKYSLLLGKKRINFYSDSGILMPTCGKMIMTYQIHLPGGFSLPVSLVKECYTLYDTSPGAVEPQEAEQLLSDALDREVKGAMVAGSVLDRQTRVQISGDAWLLTGSYECREMIARQSEGVYLQEYG